MISARVNQLEAAPASGRPIPPPAAVYICNFVNYYVNDVCYKPADAVRCDVLLRAGECHAFSSVLESAAVIAQSVSRVEVVIMRKKVGVILGDDQIAICGKDSI